MDRRRIGRNGKSECYTTPRRLNIGWKLAETMIQDIGLLAGDESSKKLEIDLILNIQNLPTNDKAVWNITAESVCNT